MKRMYKQIDIYGNEIDVNKREDERNILHGGRIPKKSMFRFINGYKLNYYCKNCKYFKEHEKYFKCEQLGITKNSSTDIRKNDIACHLYEEKNKE